MNPAPRFVFVAFFALVAASVLPAQTALTPAPTPVLAPAPRLAEIPPALASQPSADTQTQTGLRFSDFVTVNEAMTQVALADDEIKVIDAQVEALLERREALLVEKTIVKKPELAEKLRTLQQGKSELKRKKGDQAAQTRALVTPSTKN